MPDSREFQDLVSVPVVLAHGWGGTYQTTWSGQQLEAGLLKAGRRIIRLDLPGHGGNSLSSNPDDYADISDQLLANFAGESIVDAVGFSLGGKLLLDLAARYPPLFRRLVIAGVGSNLFVPENGEMIAKAIFAVNDADVPIVMRGLVNAIRASGNDVHSLAGVICHPPNPLRREALARVSASVLLIVGREDTFIGNLNELHSAMQGATLEFLDGVDHLTTTSSPAFQTLALHFLSD